MTCFRYFVAILGTCAVPCDPGALLLWFPLSGSAGRVRIVQKVSAAAVPCVVTDDACWLLRQNRPRGGGIRHGLLRIVLQDERSPVGFVQCGHFVSASGGVLQFSAESEGLSSEGPGMNARWEPVFDLATALSGAHPSGFTGKRQHRSGPMLNSAIIGPSLRNGSGCREIRMCLPSVGISDSALNGNTISSNLFSCQK